MSRRASRRGRGSGCCALRPGPRGAAQAVVDGSGGGDRRDGAGPDLAAELAVGADVDRRGVGRRGGSRPSSGNRRSCRRRWCGTTSPGRRHRPDRSPRRRAATHTTIRPRLRTRIAWSVLSASGAEFQLRGRRWSRPAWRLHAPDRADLVGHRGAERVGRLVQPPVTARARVHHRAAVAGVVAVVVGR